MLSGVRERLARHGLDPGDAEAADSDALVEESLTLAGIVSASIQGRVALGPRAGARMRRCGGAPDAEVVTSRRPRHAHLAGFDPHANGRVSADEYLRRPPPAQDRVELRPDGRVLVRLKAGSIP